MSEDHIGGGTVVGLCDALRIRIEEATKLLSLESKNKTFRAPEIVNGFVPPKRSDAEAKQPFVVVCPAEGRIEDEGFHRVKVSIIVGIRSEEFDAHEWLLTVSHRIIQNLRERPTLANRYVLEYPLTWDQMFEQPYPYWQLMMLTEWTIPTPVRLPDEEL